MTYVLHGGLVPSLRDGDLHFVDARRLASLYRLRPGTWIAYPTNELHMRMWREPPNAVHLYPRKDGNYNLPEPQ